MSAFVVTVAALLGFVIVNAIVGAVVLTSVDKDGRLFEWYRAAPFLLVKFCVLELWPIVAYLHCKDMRAPPA